MTGKPGVVLSIPPGNTMTGIEIHPGIITMPKGNAAPVEVWGVYDNGTKAQLYTNTDNTIYASSDTGIATVDAAGMLNFIAPGTVTLTVSYNSTLTVQTTVTVLDDAPLVTSASTASGSVGSTFNYQITATGTPATYGASPLPAGLSLSPSGLISGNPTKEGASDIQITATDANGTGLKIVHFTITGPPGAPTDLGLNAVAVSENKPSGTLVGRLTTTDPNPLDTFSYALVTGTGAADNASFTIVGDQLYTSAVLQRSVKSALSIRVRTTDPTNATFEKAIALDVVSPPAITFAPESQEVFVGDKPSFSVDATGLEPLIYQWQKGGVDIDGANNRIFEIAQAAQTDAGTYSVRVTNGDGTVTSASVPLTVDLASYGKWASQISGVSDAAALAANGDYNNDGIPNYLDFSFGVQPNQGLGSGAQPLVSQDANGYLLTYREANGILPQIYRILKSSDLLTWVEHQPAQGDVTRADKGAYTEVKVRVPSAEAKLFLRVKVSDQ